MLNNEKSLRRMHEAVTQDPSGKFVAIQNLLNGQVVPYSCMGTVSSSENLNWIPKIHQMNISSA